MRRWSSADIMKQIVDHALATFRPTIGSKHLRPGWSVVDVDVEVGSDWPSQSAKVSHGQVVRS